MAKRKASKAPAPVQEPRPLIEIEFGERYLINEDTGELRSLNAREGYAPPAIPAGYRWATAAEVEEYSR